MAENTNRAKFTQMWKEIYLFKCKKNVSVSVHAREQVVKMNKMLFFILFSQSAVLRPSRLLLLSTRLLFCQGVSSLRSNACLSFAILICFNWSWQYFRYALYTRPVKQTTTRLQVNTTKRKFRFSKMDAKRKKIYILLRKPAGVAQN